MGFIRIILEPVNLVEVKFFKQSNPCEHLKPVEFDELKHLLVKHLFVFSVDEVTWKDLSNPFSQEISNIPVLGGALIIQKLVNFSSMFPTKLCFFNQLLFFVFPIIRQRTVLSQEIVIIKRLLFFYNMDQNLEYIGFDLLPDSGEAEDFFVDFVYNVCLRQLTV